MGHKCWAFKFEDGITRCTNQVGPFLFCRKHRAWPLTAALAFIIGIGGLEGGFGAMFDARAAVRSEFPSLFGVKPADMVNDSVAKAITEGIPYRSMYSSSLVLSQMMNLPTIGGSASDPNAIVIFTNISGFKAMASDVEFHSGECRFLGKAGRFDKESMMAQIDVYGYSCADDRGHVYTVGGPPATYRIGYVSTRENMPLADIPLVWQPNGTLSVADVPMFVNFDPPVISIPPS